MKPVYINAAKNTKLSSLGYTDRSVRLYAVDSVSDLKAYSNKGERSTIRIVDTDNGIDKSHRGSWGGSNMFTSSIVDDVGISCELDLNTMILVIKNDNELIEVYVHPAAVGDFHVDTADLTDVQVKMLEVFQYTSSYRKSYWSKSWGELSNDNPNLLPLIDQGLLKKAGKGLSITADGKNALIKAGVRFY